MAVPASIQTGIAVATFATFYAISIASALLPYSPSVLARALLQYGLPVAIVLGGAWMGFFHHWSAWGETSWSRISRSLPSKAARVRRFAALAVSLPIFGYGVAFAVQRWPAYPTKWFATTESVVRLNCTSSEQWGRASRGRVLISGVDAMSGELISFPWPSDGSPKCPSTLVLTGRSWPLGMFVTRIQTAP